MQPEFSLMKSFGKTTLRLLFFRCKVIEVSSKQAQHQQNANSVHPAKFFGTLSESFKNILHFVELLEVLQNSA
jgi:hypothetical protein